ncbi:MAG: hypothetical protein OXI52_13185, partial [Caldilineaceae bacterium]|nr:hypothetical protein [Caldilineaceae bacterium]
LPRCLGRHKACPYGSALGGLGRAAPAEVFGQAQGLPLRERFGGIGESGACRGVWAGTRPAPTGALWGRGEAGRVAVRGQAQGLPLPMR